MGTSTTRWLLAALSLSAGIAAAPGTAHALSCSGRLVEIGDNIAYVQGVCGQPTFVSSHQEMRSVYGAYGYGYGYGSRAMATVQVDVLLYDFGPTRFIEELTFENGVLRAERTGRARDDE